MVVNVFWKSNIIKVVIILNLIVFLYYWLCYLNIVSFLYIKWWKLINYICICVCNLFSILGNSGSMGCGVKMLVFYLLFCFIIY